MMVSLQRRFGLFFAGLCWSLLLAGWAKSADKLPNIVLIYADDLGYGDLGCYGATRWRTPHLDRLAAEGIKFTSFLVSQPVCSASRTSLLTGCYANRVGIHGALGPNSKLGIHPQETLLPELLQHAGYRTGMVGKWHLGDREPFMPTQNGFDSYLGLLYSNDMWPHGKVVKPSTYPALALVDGLKKIDEDVDGMDQAKLTERYRQRALEFVQEKSDKPFFLYFAHTFPHVPLFAGEAFRGRSQGGIYGDVLEEFDAAVGSILDTIDQLGQTENTLVLFSSDNGPWLSYGGHAGTAGALREGKGSVYEGGVRVPMLARWPGKIPTGAVQHTPAMTIDVLPTIAAIVGSSLPERPIDGKDIRPLLLGASKASGENTTPIEPRVYFHYYGVNELQAVRYGRWKLQLPHTARVIEGGTPGSDGLPGKYQALKIEQPELYDLETDLAERIDVSKEHPEVLQRMLGFANLARDDMGDSLTQRVGKNNREPGRVE